MTAAGVEPAGDIYTVGHSNHNLAAFLSLLRRHGIRMVVDVRSVPHSRRHPQFDTASLEAALKAEGFGYRWMPELGGLRHPVPGSPNDGWDNEAFQGYADHMATHEFAAGLQRLEKLAGRFPTAVMCAEADWRRCHRRLLSDALAVSGWRVRHILPKRPDAEPGGFREAHPLTTFLVAEEGRITYPAAQGTFPVGF